MNPPKCSTRLYVEFLLVSDRRFSGVELSRVAPDDLSHDAVSHFLQREDLSPKDLWRAVRPRVRPGGVLILDDTVFEKRWSRENPLVHRLWSGAEKRVVAGIGLTTLLWTAMGEHLPLDYRVYAASLDGKTKLDHAEEMLASAKQRGLTPTHVLMDAVYTKLSTLKAIRAHEWHWVATLKKNRVVNTRQHLEDLRIPAEGRVVHLRGYGPIKVFRSARTSTSAGYLGTDDLTLSADAAESLFGARWEIEEFHRGLKQTTGVAECAARIPQAQRTHIATALLAFLALERYRLRTGIPWTEAKARLTRSGIADLLASADAPLLACIPR